MATQERIHLVPLANPSDMASNCRDTVKSPTSSSGNPSQIRPSRSNPFSLGGVGLSHVSFL